MSKKLYALLLCAAVGSMVAMESDNYGDASSPASSSSSSSSSSTSSVGPDVHETANVSPSTKTGRFARLRKAGSKGLKRVKTGLAYVKDGVKVVSPAFHTDNKTAEAETDKLAFEADWARGFYYSKRTDRWIGIPYNILFGVTAFFAGKKLFNTIQTRRMKNKKAAEAAQKELAA